MPEWTLALTLCASVAALMVSTINLYMLRRIMRDTARTTCQQPTDPSPPPTTTTTPEAAPPTTTTPEEFSPLILSPLHPDPLLPKNTDAQEPRRPESPGPVEICIERERPQPGEQDASSSSTSPEAEAEAEEADNEAQDQEEEAEAAENEAQDQEEEAEAADNEAQDLEEEAEESDLSSSTASTFHEYEVVDMFPRSSFLAIGKALLAQQTRAARSQELLTSASTPASPTCSPTARLPDAGREAPCEIHCSHRNAACHPPRAQSDGAGGGAATTAPPLSGDVPSPRKSH